MISCASWKFFHYPHDVMDRKIQPSLKWIKLYEVIGHAEVFCRQGGTIHAGWQPLLDRNDRHDLSSLKKRSYEPGEYSLF
jgi:hypothetical protein